MGGKPFRIWTTRCRGGSAADYKPRIGPLPVSNTRRHRGLKPQSSVKTRLEVVSGAKSVRITISQVFKLLDLVNNPEQVLESARDLTKIGARQRRALSKRQTFSIPTLGALRPVGGEADEYQGFWRTGVSTLREMTAPSILFMPLELSLTDWLNQLKPSLESVLDEALGQNENLVENKQVSGRLRIYGPGVGVSRIAITLTFRTAVHVEAVAQIAHDIEQLAFVDPNNLADPGKSCAALLQETIEKVVQFLFGEDYSKQELRWRPPETVYCFTAVEGASMEENVPALAYLLSMTVGNRESESGLEKRLLTSLNSKHWLTDRVLALAGQRALLFLIGSTYAAGRKKKQDQLRDWMMETSELIWAAAYTGQGFAENISGIARLRLLDDKYLPEAGMEFAALEGILESTRAVLRAIEVARSDIRKLGEGMLTVLARDLWRSNNNVRYDDFLLDMKYVIEWLNGSQHPKMKDLLSRAEDIVKLSSLFNPRSWGKP